MQLQRWPSRTMLQIEPEFMLQDKISTTTSFLWRAGSHTAFHATTGLSKGLLWLLLNDIKIKPD
jgi:hypothetical protein